jgi:hypothetical protein
MSKGTTRAFDELEKGILYPVVLKYFNPDKKDRADGDLDQSSGGGTSMPIFLFL